MTAIGLFVSDDMTAFYWLLRQSFQGGLYSNGVQIRQREYYLWRPEPTWGSMLYWIRVPEEQLEMVSRNKQPQSTFKKGHRKGKRL